MNRFVVTETAVIDAPVERVWEVISRTDRYAEWVAGAIEVTDHHGVATVGKTYSERNRTLGPLKTDSVWTVVEIERSGLAASIASMIASYVSLSVPAPEA